MSYLKNKNGITLIALVITIVVLLILAGVSISMLTGNNSIIKQAQNAKKETEESTEKEKIQIAVYESELKNNGYQKLTEENLQKEIDEQFGDEEAKVYSNEKDAFSVIFQNKDSAYRIESNGDVNKIDIAFKITNEEEYKEFINEVNNGNSFENQYVYLLNDLDFQYEGIDIAGNFIDESNNKPFSGIFEGNNKKINNLNINKNQDFVALFAYNKGTIRDIVLESGNITGQGRVAGIASVSDGLIKNCHNKGININITGTAVGSGGIVARCNGNIKYCSNSQNINSNTSYVAGIAGALNYGTMSNCYNIGNITGTNTIGGLVGGSYSGQIINCYNLGNIVGTNKNSANGTYVGGISGNSANDSKIINCYNNGKIKSEYINGGGIAGQLSNSSEIINCYNIGAIENQETALGNIAGSVYSESKISNSYFSKEICNFEGIGVTNDTSSIEVFNKTISYMKSNDFLNDLNKDDNIFTIDSNLNNGYPILKWQIE